jgi:hypothetical protein
MALRRAYRAASSSCKFVCTVGALTAAALAHDQLQFLAAPGSWHLWRCRRGTAARHGHAQRWVARWAYRAQRRKAGCARQHARRCPALEPSHFDRPRSKVRPTGRSFWVVLPLQLSCHSLRPPGKRFVWAKFLAQEEAFLNEEPACQWPRGSLSNAAAASESAGRIVTQNASKLRGLQCTPQKHAGSTGRLGVACINRTPPETRMSAVARDDDAPSCCAQVRERTTGSKISHPAQSCNNAELHVREPAVRGGAVGPHMH